MNAGLASTHTVSNQSRPWVDVDLFSTNQPLQDALRLHCADMPLAGLAALGAEMGSAEIQHHARLANSHKPQLHTHDRFGRRSDVVEFHPSYHALLGAAMRHGLHAAAWAQTGAAAAHAHTARAAGFLLFTEAEPSVLCPVSMSYAVVPALRGNAGIWADWHAGLTSTRYDPRLLPFARKSALTMGMGMTEKQGGSDLRANTTQAQADGTDAWGPRYRLTGHKWFFSAPMCDAFLVLARAPGGLSCFFLPRVLPAGAGGSGAEGAAGAEGHRNTLHLQRLKDKLGNHANASAEVEFIDAVAWRVGEEGRGVAQILEMGALTRLDCALGTSGLMRQALSQALHHARQRMAFGKKLIGQPLMRNVLADLALESEAATALSIRLASAFDNRERQPHEAVMARLLTPVAKFWVCKRGSAFAQEAMECLGGNGYVEEGGAGSMARIYREMPLNSIWEGAGNIMALDLLRAARQADSAAALADELAPARGAHPALERIAGTLPLRLDAMTTEAEARRLAQDMALAVQAALLYRSAPASVFGAFCASRLGGDWGHCFGTLGAGVDLDRLLERALPG